MLYKSGIFIISIEGLLVNYCLQTLSRKEVSTVEELDSVRERLKRHRLSFVWLILELDKRGIVTDKTEVSSVFAGTRRGAKADSIVQTSIAILDDYEKKFVHDD